MTDFRIVASELKKSFDGKKGGKFNVYRVDLDSGDTGVELVQKAETPAPKQGDTLTGTVDTSGDYGPKFVREAKGFGGGRPKDPAEQARILRCHSQEMAIRFMELQVKLGALEKCDRDLLAKLADWFDQDTKGRTI